MSTSTYLRRISSALAAVGSGIAGSTSTSASASTPRSAAALTRSSIRAASATDRSWWPVPSTRRVRAAPPRTQHPRVGVCPPAPFPQHLDPAAGVARAAQRLGEITAGEQLLRQGLVEDRGPP
ncbi:hypothetical protein HHL19_22585 [Streptomyces sp. R302]|uniref:hypothetical protein n=1 Tax=unclassified Streptomyces TaxID=2593676 RepID=UPI00145D7FC9|nr:MULTISPECIES: hypothetical protein [unclassified Streptomyces]NML51746.1 hypothetical protein [Streptomyces sp. R301]NML81366.1 hypothetical protein [Streptomyces sp. R302]